MAKFLDPKPPLGVGLGYTNLILKTYPLYVCGWFFDVGWLQRDGNGTRTIEWQADFEPHIAPCVGITAWLLNRS